MRAGVGSGGKARRFRFGGKVSPRQALWLLLYLPTIVGLVGLKSPRKH